MFWLVIGFAVAFGLAFVFTGLVRNLALRYQLLDIPSPRRVHATPVPRLGGIAIFASFALTTLAILLIGHVSGADVVHLIGHYKVGTVDRTYPYLGGAYTQIEKVIGLLLTSLFITVVMAYDDIRGLPPLIKLGAQIIAAVVLSVSFNIQIAQFNNPLRHIGLLPGTPFVITLSILAVPLTLLWFIGMMNTINWIDGIDGLAGGISFIVAIVLVIAVVAVGTNEVFGFMQMPRFTAILPAVLAGSCLGFLPHNWHPAKIFMGDSGAMFLGLALAALSIIGWVKLGTAIIVLGVPIIDGLVVIVRRISEKRSPLLFDKTHLHHRLLATGMPQEHIVLLLYALCAVFGIIGVLSQYAWKFVVMAGLIAVFTALLAWLSGHHATQ